MLGHITLGTNDLARSAAFHDELLAPPGARRVLDFGGRGRAWGSGKGKPMFGVIQPFDGQPASAGNGTMIAPPASDRAAVDALHAKALALKARDEGAPGMRGEHFRGACLRDPDGNRLCAFCTV